jgi:signal transduction histidine kinase
LLESFIEGEKFSVEVLVYQKKMVRYTPTWMFDGHNEYFYERAAVVGHAPFTDSERTRLECLLHKIIAAHQIDSCLLHAEVLLTESGQFQIIEVNSRLGGEPVPELLSRAFDMDWAEAFIRLLENGTLPDTFPLKPKCIVMGYEFLTHKQGNLKIKKAQWGGNTIRWNFSDGKPLQRVQTSSFSTVGLIISEAKDENELKKHLDYLKAHEDEFFSVEKPAMALSQAPNQDQSATIADHASRRIFMTMSLSVALVVALLSGFLLFQNFTNRTQFIGRALSQTLSFHVLSGEVLLIADIVNRFEAQEWMSSIVVSDRNHRVIHSKITQGFPGNFYLSQVDPSDFEFEIPIEADGLVLGYLLFNQNYAHLLIPFILVTCIAGALFILIQVAGTRWFSRRFIGQIEQQLSGVSRSISQMSDDIEGWQGEDLRFNSGTLVGELAPQKNDMPSLARLKESVTRVISSMSEIRDQIAEKRRLLSLLHDSYDALNDVKVKAQVSEAIAKTTQMLAHDVRKPFSMLRMALNMLGRAKDPEAVKNVMQRIVPEIDKAMSSVDGMIADVMEVGSTSLTLIQEPASPDSLIESTLGEVIRMYPESNISFKYEFAHTHMASVHVQKIGRVFSNIVGNSFQAMRNRGQMWFRTFESDGMIHFCIGNGGSLIPAETLPKLFEAFFTSGKKGGTGLGLAIAQKVVNAHGGKIWCESSKTAEHPDGKVEFFGSSKIFVG